MEILVKVLHPDAVLPSKAYPDDAGLDLRVPQTTLVPEGRSSIPIGIAVQLPDGHCAWITARSGIASKGMPGYKCNPNELSDEVEPFRFNVDVIAGIIDEGYRGEIGIIVNNQGPSFFLKAGQCIAQMLVLPVPKVTMVSAEHLSPSHRAGAGFGSTDNKTIKS